MSDLFECPVCGKQPKIGTYGVNIAWASCKGYAFHRHKKISVCIYDQPSTLFQSLRSHWNQIQFREARFLYDTEEEIQRLTGDRMIPKDGTIIHEKRGENMNYKKLNCKNCKNKFCPFHGVDREILACLCEDYEAKETAEGGGRDMSERVCPPDYNGGFCADYDVDCDACWEQWEQEHKAEEGE